MGDAIKVTGGQIINISQCEIDGTVSLDNVRHASITDSILNAPKEVAGQVKAEKGFGVGGFLKSSASAAAIANAFKNAIES